MCQILTQFTGKNWTAPKLRALCTNLGWYQRQDKTDVINDMKKVVMGYNQAGLMNSSPRLFYSVEALKEILANADKYWGLTKLKD